MSSKFSWRISHRLGSAKYGMNIRTPSSELWPIITSISVQFVVSKNFLPFYQFSQTLKTDCSWNLQKMFWTVMFKSLPGKIKLFWNFYFEMFPIKTGYFCVIHFCKKNWKKSKIRPRLVRSKKDRNISKCLEMFEMSRNASK